MPPKAPVKATLTRKAEARVCIIHVVPLILPPLLLRITINLPLFCLQSSFEGGCLAPVDNLPIILVFFVREKHHLTQISDSARRKVVLLATCRVS